MVTPTDATDIVLRFTWDDAFERLYASWRDEAIFAERTRRGIADRLVRRDVLLSTTSVVLMLLVAGAAVALARVRPDAPTTLGLDADRLSYAIAGAAVLAALAVVVRSLGRYAGRGEAHRVAAARYAALEREMSATLATPRAGRRAPDVALNDARQRLDRYAER
jgi:hypothetical protein